MVRISAEACAHQLALAMRGAREGPRAAADSLDEHGSALGRAWALTLRAAIGGLGDDADADRSGAAGELRAHSAPVDRALSECCAIAERRAFAAFDTGALRTWGRVRPDPHDDRMALGAEIARARRALLDGVGRSGELARLAERARALADAPAALDATSLLALAADLEGDVTAALEHARRGSRMARTEGLLELEYFANVVLARARRLHGRAYAASRILSTLAMVGSAPWRGWIGWELLLVGQRHAALSALGRAARTPAETAARNLGSGSEAELVDVTVPPLFAADHQAVLAARGLGPAPNEPIREFLEGREDRAPPRLRALLSSADRGSAFRVWVRGDGERPGRRLLGTDAPADADEISEAAPQDRVGALLSELLLAGAAGRSPEALYRRAFGAGYDVALHDGLLRTTTHRARHALGDRGDIVRADGRLRLALRSPLAVLDPRAHTDLEEKLLELLSERGVMGAQALAEALEVTTRTVQTHLRGLVDEGLCERRKQGRRVVYVLEDTTFANPTLHRLRPPD